MEPGPSGNCQIICLICGGSSSRRYLSIDACRACAEFYRRASKKKKVYSCRQGTDACEILKEEFAPCKSCRFRKFQEAVENFRKNKAFDKAHDNCTYEYADNRKPRPIMMQLRSAYHSLCKIRTASELGTRADTEILLGIAIDGTPLVLSHYESLNRATSILVSSLNDFAAAATPEFEHFDAEIKSKIIRGFYEFFCNLESTYRSLKHFPDQRNLIFGSYTSVIDLERLEEFFEGSGGSTVEAGRIMRKAMESGSERFNEAMLSFGMESEEFISALGIELWTSNDPSIPTEEMERRRAALLHELGSYYREERGIEDYATRIGGLFSLIMALKPHSTQTCEMLEVFRILDVWKDDTFAYQLSRS